MDINGQQRGPNSATQPTEEKPSPNRIAHTLTACCRCRTRKTRCDPGLPRCGPCERAGGGIVCEYYDPAKGVKIPRNYVVHLQHKVRDLERQLAELERDEGEPDAEDMMRMAAAVRTQESDEAKYLGPSSGITITRLVMQLAKQFTASKSISEIVPDSRAKSIKATFDEEDTKPTSKVYPLISDVAAEELPNRDLTNLLVELFYSKMHPMYPIFHEKRFLQVVEDIYNGSKDAYKNFCIRMVIAISLQKMDTQYAGLADSYYLAALKFFEDAIKKMNLQTLQCFALIAGYSLLTPTRTAVYYVVGLGVRLCQALGLHEEKTITLGPGGRPANPLEVDMRRRLFWCLLTMEFGLAHSLGRPSAFPQEHIDVNFFELVDDSYITKDGVLNAPQGSLKKWVAIHFFKMRMLQLEIRRKLYQRKRPEPKDDKHPWFAEMQAKMISWRDSSPESSEIENGGLDKVWFIGRYNTMVVFLFRPSPQVPRPSAEAAIKCYDACQYNVYMTKRQIETKSVDLTWIFTQSIFMAINTILWSLSYSEIRRLHSREEVEGHLSVALESIRLSSERWPGVASALELYKNLIAACMKIYEKDGDIPITAGSPSDSASVASNTIMDGINRSRTTSPATASTASVQTPAPEPPFGYLPKQNQAFFNPRASQTDAPNQDTPSASRSTSVQTSPQQAIPQPYMDPSPKTSLDARIPSFSFAGNAQFNPLPTTFAELSHWNPTFSMPPQDALSMPPVSEAIASPAWNEAYAADRGYPMTDYLYPQWGVEQNRGLGLTHEQQMELMQTFEANETGKLEAMIQQSNQLFRPQYPTH
ncbi:uncharacterized protein EI97DRAFT_457356 [Westerdykella ornata]|uniref:Zn(2)-C6 fungal-type domain-containing protein n=1 Tax=Westerdykella ornata TaxID=318751 RepID=A0A6A6JQU2_WESOR|nr:uncharacterized protein EI97DRAFT_457356 [Westerdykella ornata]KAF2277329.1 hypothetical protein EI97DRAFT_457356 [Westerdykella ornata]